MLTELQLKTFRRERILFLVIIGGADRRRGVPMKIDMLRSRSEQSRSCNTQLYSIYDRRGEAEAEHEAKDYANIAS